MHDHGLVFFWSDPMTRRILPRLATCLAALGAIAACAHAPRPQPGATSLATGQDVVSHCQKTEMLVVENRTGFPVRVASVDPGPNSFITSGELLATIASGVVDTIPGSQLSHPAIAYDVERPSFSNGMPLPVSGLRAWCTQAG
jgi:hypothetical protein